MAKLLWFSVSSINLENCGINFPFASKTAMVKGIKIDSVNNVICVICRTMTSESV